jgi:hypothetical protein
MNTDSKILKQQQQQQKFANNPTAGENRIVFIYR